MDEIIEALRKAPGRPAKMLTYYLETSSLSPEEMVDEVEDLLGWVLVIQQAAYKKLSDPPVP